jgi:hypothetical protein
MLNALAACIVSILLTIAVLESDLTPFRIVSRAEWQALNDRASAANAVQRPGDWMFDPTRKTMLDKPAERAGGVNVATPGR